MQTRYGIYIGNVDRSVTLDQLKVVFGPCGNIVDASMNGSAENAYRFAFMDFATDEERQRALRLHGITLANRDLKVAVSKGVNSSGTHQGGVAPQRNNYQQQPMGAPQYMGGGGYPPQQYGGYPPQQGYPPMQQAPPQQPSPQVIQQIIASMQAAGQLRPGQEPTQQQLQAIAAAAIAVQQPQQPPPHMMGGGYPGGGYHPQQQQPMMQQMRAPQHTPANPPPTMEELALRAKQREQYLAKLRSEGERYETKIKKLLARGRGEAGGSGSDSSSSDSSSDSDDEAAPTTKQDASPVESTSAAPTTTAAAVADVVPAEAPIANEQQQVVAAVAESSPVNDSAAAPLVTGEKRAREEDENSIEA